MRVLSTGCLALALLGHCAAATDKDRYVQEHPKAEAIEWRADGEPTYAVLYAVEGNPKDLRGAPRVASIAVFDPAGRRLYERKVRNREEELPTQCLEHPTLFPALGCVLGFTSSWCADKTTTTSLILVGLRDGRPKELEVAYSCFSSYPIDYHHRTWLEDLDGDGKPELCQFVGNPLQCHTWDRKKGEWRELRQFTAARLGTSVPPFRWLATAKLHAEGRRLELRLDITSLVECPVVLSQPLPPLLGAVYYWSPGPPEGGFPGPIAVEMAQRLPEAKHESAWAVKPKEAKAETLTIAPLASRTLLFSVALPEDARTDLPVALTLTGRARWRCFEANFSLRQETKLEGLAPDRQPTQDQIDEELKKRVEKGWCDNTSRASTAFRSWLIHSALYANRFGNFFNNLGADPADETGHLALDALRKNPRLPPDSAKQLLLVALRRRAPAEYQAVLAEAGGPGKGLEPALIELLAAPRFREEQTHSGWVHYLDMKTLAALLAGWPGEELAARAKATLAREADARDRPKTP